MLFAVLSVAVVLFALLAIRAKRLLASALWLAGVSALLAILLYQLGTQQVAVIELSVGAGLVTVLFVFAIGVAGDDQMEGRAVLPKQLAWLLAVAAVALLGLLAWPLSQIEPPPVEASVRAVFWQDRGLDAVVQVVLIFSGVLGLLGLLAEARAPLEQPAAREVAARREKELLALEMTSVSGQTETPVQLVVEGSVQRVVEAPVQPQPEEGN